jgi:hypothetical protein
MHSRSDNPLTVKDVSRLVASFFKGRTASDEEVTSIHGTITHGASTFKVTIRYVPVSHVILDINDNCIKLHIYRKEIDLVHYYFLRHKADCPELQDDDFFSFLKSLATRLQLPVIFDAYSIDKSKCRLSDFVFSLVGKPTFFEQHGFKSKAYTDSIKKLRKMTFQELVTGIYNHRQIGPEFSPLTKSSSMEEVAKYIISHCNGGKMTELADKIMFLIEDTPMYLPKEFTWTNFKRRTRKIR